MHETIFKKFLAVKIDCTPLILSLQCSCESSKFIDNLALLKRKADGEKNNFSKFIFGVQIDCIPLILSLQCSCESSKFFDSLVLREESRGEKSKISKFIFLLCK